MLRLVTMTLRLLRARLMRTCCYIGLGAKTVTKLAVGARHHANEWRMEDIWVTNGGTKNNRHVHGFLISHASSVRRDWILIGKLFFISYSQRPFSVDLNCLSQEVKWKHKESEKEKRKSIHWHRKFILPREQFFFVAVRRCQKSLHYKK